jgi:hypothetical protein
VISEAAAMIRRLLVAAALVVPLAGVACQPAQPQRPVVFTCPACGGVNSHKCPHCHGYPHEPARWHW